MSDIQRDGPVPLYHQVGEILRAEIGSGTLKPGQRVATEFELMQRFGVSRTTVRQTIARLRKEGLLSVHRGRGTFVVRHTIEPELSALTGFAEDMQALGLTPSARVLGIATVKASPRVAQALGVPTGEKATKITRVRLAEEVPVSFEFSFLPFDLGTRVAEENLEVSPIFSLLEDKYGVLLSDAVCRIEATRATRMVASALDIERGAPVLAIERTTYSTSGRAVDFEQMYYRGDRIRYTMRLQRRRRDP